MFAESPGQASGLGTAGKACLCSVSSGASAGSIHGWALESLKAHSLAIWWLVLTAGWVLSASPRGFPTGLSGRAGVGFLYSIVAGFLG